MNLSSVEPATGTNAPEDCARAFRGPCREPTPNITRLAVASLRKLRRDNRAASTDANVGLSVGLHGWASSSISQRSFDDASIAPSVFASTSARLTPYSVSCTPRLGAARLWQRDAGPAS